jgi:DhnA family fructose-bisphosphate aldolase class Ia
MEALTEERITKRSRITENERSTMTDTIFDLTPDNIYLGYLIYYWISLSHEDYNKFGIKLITNRKENIEFEFDYKFTNPRDASFFKSMFTINKETFDKIINYGVKNIPYHLLILSNQEAIDYVNSIEVRTSTNELCMDTKTQIYLRLPDKNDNIESVDNVSNIRTLHIRNKNLKILQNISNICSLVIDSECNNLELLENIINVGSIKIKSKNVKLLKNINVENIYINYNPVYENVSIKNFLK